MGVTPTSFHVVVSSASPSGIAIRPGLWPESNHESALGGKQRKLLPFSNSGDGQETTVRRPRLPVLAATLCNRQAVLTGNGVPTPAQREASLPEPIFPPLHPSPATSGSRDKLHHVCPWKKAVGRLTLDL